MADTQTMKIEIPIEVFNKTDASQIQALENSLKNVVNWVERMKSGFVEGAGAMNRAAASTDHSLDGMRDSLKQVDKEAKTLGNAANSVENEFDGVADSAKETDAAMGGVGDSAKQAGQGMKGAGDSASQASGKADKFSKSMEKTEQQLGKLTRNRHEIMLELKDKATAAMKNAWTTAKNLASKTFYVALRMKDFVTAPFRKLWQTVFNPLTAGMAAMGISVSFTSALSTFNDFTTKMSEVKALTGATEVQFSQLTAQARELGATTAFSAAEAAAGMTYLGMAGWETESIMAAMPGLLDLAAAGGTDLATTADIVSDVMTAMGIAAQDAGHVADVFAKTATSSNTTIEGLGEAMKYAAPVAKSFGMNLEQTSAMLAMMANAGIKGGNAGTALRSSLLRLASPGTEAAKMLKSLNVSFTETDGSMKSIETIVSDLTVGFQKLTEQERLQYAQEIFGTEASSAWMAVLDQGAGTLSTLTTQLVNSTGAAQGMAATRLDNLAGDIEELGGAVDEAKIALMEGLDPQMRAFVQWLTAQVPGATTLVTGLIETVIAKAGDMKTAIDEMTNSDAWENANFAEKLMIAWDTLIVQPFDDWWASGGSVQITGIASTIGETMGGTLSGIILGALSMLSGKEIDYEGLNMTPIAKAGLETGAAFLSSFAEAFDIQSILEGIPDAVGAVLGDAAKLLPGGEDPSATSWLSAGAAVWGGSKLFAFFSDLGISVGTVKTGLEATGAAMKALALLPAPVVAAGLIIAGVAAGVAIYTAEMERQRQALLDMGKAVDAAVQNVEDAQKRAETVEGIIEDYAELQEKIGQAETYGGDLTQAETDLNDLTGKINDLNTALDTLEGRQITVGAADVTSITTALAGLEGSVETIESAIALIEGGVSAGTVTAASYTAELANLKTLTTDVLAAKAVVEAGITSGTVTAGSIADALNSMDATLQSIETAKSILEAGFTAGEITYEDYTEQMGILDGYASTVNAAREAIEAGVTAGPIDVTTATQALASLSESVKGLEAAKAIIESGITTGAVTASTYEGELESISATVASLQSAIAIIEKGVTAGTIDAESVKTALVNFDAALGSIEAARAVLEAGLTAGTITAADYETQMKALDDYATSINAARVEMAATLTAAGFDLTTYNEQKQTILDDVAELNEKKAVIQAIIDEGGLTPDGLSTYEGRLEELGAALVNLSNGLITQYDVENGKVAEKLGLLQQQLGLEQEIARIKLENQLAETEKKMPELKTEMDGIQASIGVTDSALSGLSSITPEIVDIRNQYERTSALYAGGKITDEEYTAGGKLPDGTEFQGMQSLMDRYNEMSLQVSALNATVQGERGFNLMESIFGGTGIDGLQYFNHMAGFAMNPEDQLKNFDEFIQGVGGYMEKTMGEQQTRYSEYNRGMATYQSQYEGYKTLLELDFLDGAGIEEQAANYASLTAEQRASFAEAVAGLEALNQQMDYLPDEMQLDVAELWRKAMESFNAPEIADTVAGQPVTAGTTGMTDSEVGAAITNLQARTAQDKYGDTQYTQQLKDNESAYSKLEELKSGLAAGSDVTDLYSYFKDRYGVDYSKSENPVENIQGEVLGERQGIHNAQYSAIEQGVAAVGQIDSNIQGLQAQNAGLDQQQASLITVLDTLNQYKTTWSELDQGEQQQALTEVNTALQGAGMESITSLGEIESAITSVKEATSAIDAQMTANLTAIDTSNKQKVTALNALTNAFDTTAWNANREVNSMLKMSEADTGKFNSLADSVGDVRKQCQNLAGTYNVKLRFTFSVGQFNFGMANGGIVGNAEGGMYPSGGFLSWIAEDGPEAIIPLGAKRRDRGLELWQQAGKALGVMEFAEGGIAGSGAFRMMDEHEGTEDPFTAAESSNAGMRVEQAINVSPVFKIESADSDNVMEKIRDHMPELVEELSDELSGLFEDIYSNVPK